MKTVQCSEIGIPRHCPSCQLERSCVAPSKSGAVELFHRLAQREVIASELGGLSKGRRIGNRHVIVEAALIFADRNRLPDRYLIALRRVAGMEAGVVDSRRLYDQRA